MTDIPFEDCTAQANDVISAGGAVFQKFTCGACGARQTMAVANTFYRSGTCEECGATTPIAKCGFMAVLGGSR